MNTYSKRNTDIIGDLTGAHLELFQLASWSWSIFRGWWWRCCRHSGTIRVQLLHNKKLTSSRKPDTQPMLKLG